MGSGIFPTLVHDKFVNVIQTIYYVKIKWAMEYFQHLCMTGWIDSCFRVPTTIANQCQYPTFS